MDERPFIYIASLRRTGSTVVSEALTALPYCFIFREPRLDRGTFKIKPSDLALFRGRGLDLELFRSRWEHGERTPAVQAFRDELVPELKRHVSQVGVKEIVHDDWRTYRDAFPAMRIVLTARDPRDVYLSVRDWTARGRGKFVGNLSPQRVADHLNSQFRFQREMAEVGPTLKVRYEDFCVDPAVYEELKTFVGCDIPGVGDVGRFNAANPKRVDEYELHGADITMKRVGRWRLESDKAARAEAEATFDLMPEYCAFWGYDRGP